jgi:NADH-quinone oxidoreductase subunit E
MKIPARQLKSTVKTILEKYNNDHGMLVGILQDTQAELGYLPKEAITEISKQLVIPLSQVYSVSTFFKAFSLKPRGRHQIHVCMGTACHVRGADRVLDEVEREHGIKSGEHDKELRFSLETVNCVGACALGPIVVVDSDYAGDMKPDSVKPLLAKYK